MILLILTDARVGSVNDFVTLAYSAVTDFIMRAVLEDMGTNLAFQSPSQLGFDAEIL